MSPVSHNVPKALQQSKATEILNTALMSKSCGLSISLHWFDFRLSCTLTRHVYKRSQRFGLWAYTARFSCKSAQPCSNPLEPWVPAQGVGVTGAASFYSSTARYTSESAAPEWVLNIEGFILQWAKRIHMSMEQQAFSTSLEKGRALHSHFLLSSEQGSVPTVTVGKTHPCEHTLHRAHLGCKLPSASEVNTNEFIQGENSILSKLSSPGAKNPPCTELHGEHASQISADVIGSVQYLCSNLDWQLQRAAGAFLKGKIYLIPLSAKTQLVQHKASRAPAVPQEL